LEEKEIFYFNFQDYTTITAKSLNTGTFICNTLAWFHHGQSNQLGSCFNEFRAVVLVKTISWTPNWMLEWERKVTLAI